MARIPRTAVLSSSSPVAGATRAPVTTERDLLRSIIVEYRPSDSASLDRVLRNRPGADLLD